MMMAMATMGDYEIEGGLTGLYCDRIPVVPARAMTVLFAFKLCCIWYTGIHRDTGAQHCDDLMAACLRRNPWQNVTLGPPKTQSSHVPASGHKHQTTTYLTCTHHRGCSKNFHTSFWSHVQFAWTIHNGDQKWFGQSDLVGQSVERTQIDIDFVPYHCSSGHINLPPWWRAIIDGILSTRYTPTTSCTAYCTPPLFNIHPHSPYIYTRSLNIFVFDTRDYHFWCSCA